MPERIGRYEFTVEAWIDRYGTLCRDIELKRAAGADIAVEIAEARYLLDRAHKLVTGSESKVIAQRLEMAFVTPRPTKAPIFCSRRDLREVMHEAEERQFPFPSRASRFCWMLSGRRRLFAAWYELFPRSTAATRTGTALSTDVIRRLPGAAGRWASTCFISRRSIRSALQTARAGTTRWMPTPDDVGSPYAIGSSEGGHDAIHPALGTIEDFRRLARRSRRARHGVCARFCHPVLAGPSLAETTSGMVQLAPGRIDTICGKSAEKIRGHRQRRFLRNGSDPRSVARAPRHRPVLDRARGCGFFVSIIRTQSRCLSGNGSSTRCGRGIPDVIFLSEAFTRPKMMYRLAKVGFSQSYTYFTWRNTKQELTDYFIELTTSEVKEFFRPHLFVNTPDINPFFPANLRAPGISDPRGAGGDAFRPMGHVFRVSSSARPRLCRAARNIWIPKNMKFAFAGSTRRETSLPRLQNSTAFARAHPALQSHLGLRFYPAHNDQVIFYGKGLPAGRDMILCRRQSRSVSTCRRRRSKCRLWEWGLPDDGSRHCFTT